VRSAIGITAASTCASCATRRAVVDLQFGVAQGQDLDLVSVDRRGGLEVSYLLGVPPLLLLAGLVQFPHSLSGVVRPRDGVSGRRPGASWPLRRPGRGPDTLASAHRLVTVSAPSMVSDRPPASRVEGVDKAAVQFGQRPAVGQPAQGVIVGLRERIRHRPGRPPRRHGRREVGVR
jgi:hypothetical protein